MSGKCTGCGDCCAVVTIARPRWERITRPRMEESVDADLAFMLRYWHEMTPEEAAAVAPYDNAPMWQDFWAVTAKDNALLRCDAFDYQTKRCTKYEERPGVCRGFPWYGDEKLDPRQLYRMYRCGYWGDVPQAEWPAWLDLVELARQGVAPA